MKKLSKKELKEYIESMGAYDKKTLRDRGECKFTGYCADEDAADGARKAFFNGETDVEELLNEGFNSWLKSCNDDAEFQLSDEALIDFAFSNDYEFDEEGNII